MIGIIGAMQEEIDLLLAALEDAVELQRSGIRYVAGSLHGRSVVVCKSGVGKVNAAICTQVLIDRFNADKVIFTGVAGALDPELDIGDIVVSTTSAQHDIDVTALGYARSVIPYQDVSDWAADPALSAAAQAAGDKLYPGHVKAGKVLSGDQFIADRQLVLRLREELGGACVEMEGASVAQVCAMNKVPYVVIRSISDKADGSADVNFAEFTVTASNRSFAIVDEMLQHI